MEADIRRSNESSGATERGKSRAVLAGGGGGLGPFLVLGGALAAAAFTSRVLQRRGLNTTSGGAGQVDGDSVLQKDVPIDSTAVDGRVDADSGEERAGAVEGRLGSGVRDGADGDGESRAAEVEGRRGNGSDGSANRRPAPRPPVPEQQPLLPAPPQQALLPSPPVLLALPPPSTDEEDNRRPQHSLAETVVAPEASPTADSQRQYSSPEGQQPANEEGEEEEAETEEEAEEDQDGVDEQIGGANEAADEMESSEEPESTQVSGVTTVDSTNSSLESSTEPIWPAEAPTDSSSTATSRPSTPEEEHGMKLRNDAFQAVDGKGAPHADGGRSVDKRRRSLAEKPEKGLVVVPTSGLSSRAFIQLAMTMAAVMAFLALAHHHGDIAAACRRLYRELFPSG